MSFESILKSVFNPKTIQGMNVLKLGLRNKGGAAQD